MNQPTNLVELEVFWKTSSWQDRVTLIKRCFDLVGTNNGMKKPEAIAEASWDELLDDGEYRLFDDPMDFLGGLFA